MTRAPVTTGWTMYDNEPRRFEDLDSGALTLVALIFLVALIAAALTLFAPSCSSAPDRQAEPAKGISIDTSNSALMHSYGMPTKEDVMEWHMHGQWGYWEDGRLCAFDELPGRAERWDSLYGIEPNPAFDK